MRPVISGRRFSRFVLAGCVVGSSLLITAQTTEPWQTSWDEYVAAYNGCVKSANCDRAAMFGGKQVTWEATLTELNMGTEPFVAKLGLNPLPILVTNPPTTWSVIAPDIREGTLENWKTVQVGSKIRVRLTVGKNGGIFSFTLFGPPLATSEFEDAELVSVAPMK